MNTVYRVSINQDDPDYSARYDTYSQVHVTPHRHLLQNVVKAEKPIFLNQIHEDYKCVEYEVLSRKWVLALRARSNHKIRRARNNKYST